MGKPIVYIAGPYTYPNPIHNINKVIKFANTLYKEGVIVPFIPHLNMMWDLVEPQTAGFFYEYDLHILSKCDALFKMPGLSIGAEKEVRFAKKHKIPVYTDIAELYKWARVVVA